MGEYTHNNILVGPAIGVGGTIYLLTLKSTVFISKKNLGRDTVCTNIKPSL